MQRPESSGDRELQNLNDSDLILADPDLDIRGRKVVDPSGAEIGHVSDLFVDASERKVRMLQIRTGGGFLGIGDRHVLLPVDAIAGIAKDAVRVNETRERVVKSPAYEPKLLEAPTPSFWEPYYGYYGLMPYWGSSYLYPQFPVDVAPLRPHHTR
jgi:sporulation protein YlmC with PRC-barrel domain